MGVAKLTSFSEEFVGNNVSYKFECSVKVLFLKFLRLRLEILDKALYLRFNKFIQLPIEHFINLRCFNLGPMVFHHLIRMHNIRTNLASPLNCDFLLPYSPPFFLLTMQFKLIQTRP